MSNSRIKGTYVAAAARRAVGRVRWLDPTTGEVFATATAEQPTVMYRGVERPDGSWDIAGHYTWRADPSANCQDSQAFKADDGKPNWFLLMSGQGCAKALAGVVRVLSFAVRSKDKGGKGYAEHSWRQVPNAKERYQAALYRHLNKLELGEKLDDESGESHWYHICANALFLAELHDDSVR